MPVIPLQPELAPTYQAYWECPLGEVAKMDAEIKAAGLRPQMWGWVKRNAKTCKPAFHWAQCVPDRTSTIWNQPKQTTK